MLSPIRVAVPWASINPTSPVVIPDFVSSKALVTAKPWPSGFGAAMAFPFPSELDPIPLITAWIVSPSLMASFILLRTSTPAPSPMTKPPALSSKGKDPFPDSAPIFAKPTNVSGPRLVWIPPTMTASDSPERSSLLALSSAASDVAQAASMV